MKIEIVGKRELVTSVEVSKDDVANQLHILINTRDRWAPHQLSGGWGIFASRVPAGAAPRAHRIVAVGAAGQDEAETGAEVVFLPENDEETALLSGIAYEGSEKDQISYIIVPLSLESVRRLQPLARTAL
ncbi:hypothetical protein KTD31_01210 [Burkholderia multivorans]|uniref:hypothetical protein n=1 Tax=Burkholderia multivorans TaxID=87883 RepID=UPI001C22A6BA|nr:hypothetical protein [Burkholderia multivorans]MBU9200021.1 hypothetical protein [Burkholderia multivorans]MDN8078860.1 hypothetical protein [Burkholderia multivorans]